tara:strand:+ start:210 stop:416 length:207 start_codon:yes stop_codon:yes gene_type:complete
MRSIKDLCHRWQYKSPINGGIFIDHGDVRSMVYNFCQMTYKCDKSEEPQFSFEIADFAVNFRDMTEIY